ncbi:hypothetical protein [Streptomyces sp. SID8014]|uniref:hypothetical protein n=1 Tax=Streptomyces sp. SID8014 TaxID=2706097 RepID=UPI00194387BA|nr:hypothetical protein [Streptomyces sp. SID8014]
MDIDVAQVTAQAWPFVGAAVAAYGAAVVTRASDAGADATVALGQRVLQRLWHREEDRPRLTRALEDTAQAPGDTAAQDALREEIRRLLGADACLAREVADLLGPARVTHETYSASGQGSAVVRENHGVINLGGDVTIQR